MQFIEDDRIEIGEQVAAVGMAQQERKLFGRRHEDVGGLRALALAAADRGVAGARLGADRKPHLLDRRRHVARDVDGQRLQRRDVERVQAGALVVGTRAAREAHEARQEAGERLAGPGRRDEQCGAALGTGGEQRQLVRPRRPAARGEPLGKRLRQRWLRLPEARPGAPLRL